ncbi:hypothetical protein SAMN02745751_00131 [Dethiosulfatibacter aminovorans DSM 17477]|uniref:Uncharacterized protein n=1 Tax=Dethiosulfatibacter aminovorans DSM 17477 TaxID=1121476 RepID=A0A1M6AI83_9FIRM|nr:hypothetical protein [Dethiosulfatibacter aminovorans]SHI36199.1 hypothetical protein SAMN02745751_00131 [Dethiosulfatibacter aminovorans DSM 17477]
MEKSKLKTGMQQFYYFYFYFWGFFSAGAFAYKKSKYKSIEIGSPA